MIRTELRRLLARQGYQIAEAGSVREAESDHDPGAFDLVIADVRLPGAPGTDLVARYPGIPVLVMTSYATVRSAVDTMKLGATEYLPKPFDHDEMLRIVEAILARPRPAGLDAAQASAATRSGALAREEGGRELGMIGSSPVIREVFERIRKVAPSDATVLVLGESGTGKELVAVAIHRHSRRRDRAFVPVNCAAIPEGLIESELFGHERGAFTGATHAHAGLVEAADGGTLFLDEIGELPASAQARLLRFLQTGEVRHVGATRARRVSVRLVAATHRDLQAMVREGTFRSDLYFRLRVIEVRLPPLRERAGDAVTLARSFVARAAAGGVVRAVDGAPGVGTAEEARFVLSPEAERAIMAHPWPGNVRELENAIERAVVLCEGGSITPELLGLEEGETSPDASAMAAALPAGAAESSLSLEDYFRKFVLDHQEHLTETEIARRLGISRKTLWERRQRLGLPRHRGG
ncbi:Two-component sensor CbrB: intrcellular carbon:nitrogen balance [Chondromyces apiculatus DSM 436]|uniref:Two-component sensor CbrB: intrcellular carbon:nitrogen balance n=1 Tax=Chondromyces apiculatus DSM 436 TaxID=1192034 RepID=A0A017T144_9BACT|nr:Two-component sensor CbrB: intrcellular carbon:nitrogen balance [Chondromyces apiculatus DSM 436]